MRTGGFYGTSYLKTVVAVSGVGYTLWVAAWLACRVCEVYGDDDQGLGHSHGSGGHGLEK